MNYQKDVILQLLLLLGVHFIWEVAEAEENMSTTEHFTDTFSSSSNTTSGPEYLTDLASQVPVNYSLDNWSKDDSQTVHEQSGRNTLLAIIPERPDYNITMMESTTEFLNEGDDDFPHVTRRFNANDLSKILEIVYSSEDMPEYKFNRFSSYNLFDILEANEKKCTENPEAYGSCACDPDCRKYGDCCPDSVYFTSEEQKVGNSPFICTETVNGDVYTVGTCHSGWNNPFVRYKCEHPKQNYGDPLRYIPVTSLRTNISYRNSHCAVCNNDYLHYDIQLWSIALLSTFDIHILEDIEQPERRLVYASENSTWYLNLTGAYVQASAFDLEECPSEEEIRIKYNGKVQSVHILSHTEVHHSVESAPLMKCLLLPLIPTTAIDNMRRCEMTIHKCAENWHDASVKELCEAYYAPVYQCQDVYRNRHCVKCNNWNPTVNSKCVTQYPPEYQTDWHFTQYICEPLHVFDPVFLQCRLLFDPEEYKPESIQEPISERRMILQTGEYVLSNDRSKVFVPAHNRLYNHNEFAVQDQQVILYLSRSSQGEYLPVLDYVSATSISIALVTIILHIIVSLRMPETGVMEKNLRSFCFSLLLVYFSFIVSGTMTLGSRSCMFTATLLHYALLTSFFWMLIIPLDVLRTIRRMEYIQNHLEESWCGTFNLYSSLSWLTPIIIVATTTAIDIMDPESSFAPGYGKPVCWINRSSALITFSLVPIALILILNTVITSWSACLILEVEETLVFHSELRFSARLVVLMNLCWIVGIFATYVNTHGAWNVFVILHALQGVYIFFGSSFKQIGKKMMIE